MAVGSIPASFLSDMARSATANLPGLGNGSTTQLTSVSTATNSPAFRDAVRQYDIRQITPREFSNLIERLHDSGTISDADHKELAQLRAELDQSGAGSDEPINLLDFVQNKLAKLQKKSTTLPAQNLDSGNQQLAAAQKQLDWVRKFATIQSSADSQGVDAVA